MIKLLDGSYVKWYDYLFLFCFIIHAANASLFVRAQFTNPFDPCVLLLLSFSIIYAIIKKVTFTRPAQRLFAYFTIYTLITAAMYVNFAPFFLVKWYLTFFMAYVICRGLGKQLFPLFETTIFHLCIISLIFFPFLIIAPDALVNVATRFQFSENYNEVMDVINCVVYTVIPDLIFHMDEAWHIFPRNCGFAWEPGAFSCFICLAIFCHSLRGKMKLKGNLVLIVYFAALFTTESTTGFAMLGMMTLVWLIVEKKYKYLIIIAPIVIYSVALPFVGAKIETQVDNLQNSMAGGELSGERLPALYICWMEFIKHPILGIGGMNTPYEDMGISVWSGIGNMLAHFGLIMTGIFWWIVTKTSKSINAVFSNKNGYILLAAILSLMLSYNVWDKPLFIAFCFWGLFYEDVIAQKSII